jgi:hypothetical protein
MNKPARPAFLASRVQPVDDLTGQRFGLVVVVRRAPSLGRGARWWVQCDCGAPERAVYATHLRSSPPFTHKPCRLAQRRSA